MEISVLLLILIVIWYYGHSLTIAHESNSQNIELMLAELFKIKEATEIIAQNTQGVGQNIDLIEKSVDQISDYVNSVNAELGFINKDMLPPMLQKFDEINASSSLENIEVKLDIISSNISSISAHPAFTKVDYDED